MSSISLLSSTSRVETPFITVKIGEYEFGVSKNIMPKILNGDKLTSVGTPFPNYIQKLDVVKVNGKVSTYTIQLEYAVNENNDPNFFEKVFSSVSSDRKITISYGDLSLPNYCYRNDVATITKIKTSFSPTSSNISYTINATSVCNVLTGGSETFGATYRKPSEIILELLQSNRSGILEVFTGMKNVTKVRGTLIPTDDISVDIPSKTNISVLDYISFLVGCMTPTGTNPSELNRNGATLYTMVVVDDTTDEYGGTYFKIVKSDSNSNNNSPYEIDIGYPSQNAIIDFKTIDDENYSILYNYQNSLTDTNYSTRIGDDGKLQLVYAPIISNSTTRYTTNASEKTWWTNMVSYPIKASITMKGLLRPSILMTYVRINVYFYGKKHVSSGLYIVTKQEDSVGSNGYETTLNLTRVGGD